MARYIERLTPVSEALRLLRERVSPVEEWGDVPVWEANGMVLARDIHAPIDWPPRDRSAYDGYAVRSVDTPGRLRLVGSATIGSVPGMRLGPGEAVYVTTGGYLPEGADAVVPEEKAVFDGEYVIIDDRVEPGSYVDKRGSLVAKGQLVAKRGSVLTILDIAGLVESAITEVPVYRRVRVAIVSTGNELIYPGEPAWTAREILSGKVVATTGGVIAQYLQDYVPWAELVHEALLPDNLDAVSWTIERLLPHVDIVLVTGGTGPSTIDLFYRLKERLGGELVFRGLKVVGGKPTSAYIINGKPVIGLSGYPISALHGFIRLVYPLLLHMGNVRRPAPPLPIVWAVLASRIEPKRPRPIKVRLRVEDTKIIAEPLPWKYQKSSAGIGLVMADGLALTGEDPLDAGSLVPVLLYRAPAGWRPPVP